MSLSFLHFLERIELTDEFFRTLQALVLTRREFATLGALSGKGYFKRANINRLIKDKKIVEGKQRRTAKNGEDDVTSTIEAYRELNAKCIITEDPFLRRKLREEGINVVATPDLIGYMARKKVITKDRALEAVEALKVFGWYNNKVLDQIKEAIRRD
jgi:rRNA-processing protein FCF1